MAGLLARFQLVDEMSEKLDAMAQHGQDIVSAFEDAESAANAIFDGIESGVSSAVSTIDGVAHSITEYTDAAGDAAASTGELSDALADYGSAAGDAAAQAGQTADALTEQEQMFMLCEKSAAALTLAMDASTDAQGELEEAMQKASDTAEELAKNENVSAEAKEELARAATAAEAAMRELEAAQQEAADAMANYDAVLTSGTDDLAQLEAAAERAMHAAENLATANAKAADATEELGKAADSASEEAQKGGQKGVNAIEAISTALATAGITAKLKEIAEGAYEMAEAFSEAESTVVKATGATGAALDDLMQSTMAAYAASKSGTLDETAAAIGEINTRMALTGDELTDVTGKFLDYANITGTNVVSSVQNVTKVMNQWGVEGDNVESVLDRLAYAGQISGASVDSLSSTLISGAASFQQAGLSLDNTIQMLADFELAGISGTTAITAMRTAVNNFSKDGRDANVALQETIEQIANMGNQSEATALAVDVFGSRAGQQLAAAIQRGTISVETFNSTLEAADGTLAKTADAAQTLSQKWEQANNNIAAAFTSALSPAIERTSSELAGFVNGIGTFLNEHPAVTKALTAVGVGLGLVTAGVVAYTFATKVAIPIIGSFGTAMNLALGPVGWVALGLTAVTAAVAAFVAMSENGQDATERLTYASREHERQLDSLNAKYEEACKVYGQTSEQAGELALQISQLESSYEGAGRTIGEFIDEISESGEAIANIHQSYEDAISAAATLQSNSTNLASQLLVLSGHTSTAGADLDVMSGIVDKLNGSYDNLGLTIDETTGKLNMSVPDLYGFIQEQAEEQKKQAASDALVEAIGKYGEVRQEMLDASAETSAAWDNLQELEEQWKQDHPIKNAIGLSPTVNKDVREALSDWSTLKDASADAYANYNELTDEITRYCEALGYSAEETEEFLEQLKAAADGADQLAESLQSVEEETISYEQAAQVAFQSVQAEIEELCQAYDDAYQAALSSFEGQFGLFDTATANMDASVGKAQEALDSQLAYWQNYNANLAVLQAFATDSTFEALGITEDNYRALMAYVQSGTEEAAGLAASMVADIQSGSEDAGKAVAQLADTLGQVQTEQEAAAKSVAEWETNFNQQLTDFADQMKEIVTDDLNLEGEAAESAAATIDGYIDAIRAEQDNAVEAARQVAESVANALEANPITVRINVQQTTTAPGHARGTTYAEDFFVAGEEGPELIARPAATYANGTTDSDDYYIAGENGPELIVGQQGSTVFPTEETDRLIAALDRTPEETTPQYIIQQPQQPYNYAYSTSDTDRLIAALSAVEPQEPEVFPTEGTDRLSDVALRREPLDVRGPEPERREDGGETETRSSRGEQVKRILLEIAGSGAIDIGSSDEETVLAIMQDNLKPVLMNILKGEIYEEGELSYDF